MRSPSPPHTPSLGSEGAHAGIVWWLVDRVAYADMLLRPPPPPPHPPSLASQLNRRERRHIRRTLVDLLKLLPFALVLALPGGSIAVPICLRCVPVCVCVCVCVCPHCVADSFGARRHHMWITCVHPHSPVLARRFAPGLLPSTFVKRDDQVTPNMDAIKTHISTSLQSRVRHMVEDLDAKQDREENLARVFHDLEQQASHNGAVRWDTIAKTFTDVQVLDLVDTEELRVMFRLLGGRPVGGHALLKFRFLRYIDSIRLDDDLINVRVAWLLWVVGCGLWVVGCGVWGCGLWVVGCGLYGWLVIVVGGWWWRLL